MSHIVVTPDGRRHIFPDTATPEQMKQALAAYRPDSTGAPQAMMTPQANPAAQYGRSLQARALGLLPGVGGMLGGIGGGLAGEALAPPLGGFPGALAGAAAGGAGGEALRRGIMGQPLQAGPIAAQGGEQAAYEALGRGIGALGGRVAVPLMRRALGTTKTVLSDFPEVAKTAVREGAIVSEKGAARASAARAASARALNGILGQAKRAGFKFSSSDVSAQARQLLKSNVLPENEKAAIARQLNIFEKRWNPPAPPPQASTLVNQYGRPFTVKTPKPQQVKLSPTTLKRIKRFYQTRARQLYRAEKTGALSLAQSNRALFSEKMAAGARQQLERIPGVASREARTQELIGLERAIKDAVMRAPEQPHLHMPLSYPIIRSRHLQSALAVALGSARFRAIARQSPRLAATLLQQAMYSAPADVTQR